jgi:hypothetical protein
MLLVKSNGASAARQQPANKNRPVKRLTNLNVLSIPHLGGADYSFYE